MTSTSMASTEGTGARAAGSAHRLASSEWAVRLGRVGLAARGVLYLTVALLCFRIAMGEAGATADKQGALVTLVQQPFGRWILILTAIGLVAYSLWCVLKAFLVDEDSEAKAWAKRAGCIGRAIIYGSAFVAAVSVLQAEPQASTNQKGQSLRTLQGMSYGPWIIVVTAIGLGLFGIYSFAEARWRDLPD